MPLSPPRAPQRKARRKSARHSPDPWHWLENIDDPQTTRYLKAENAFYNESMKPLSGLNQTLYEQLKGRMAEEDSSIPEKDGDYWYYVRYASGQQYPLYCRKKGELEAAEEIYLDHNALSAGHEFCDLGFADVSPDDKCVAYGVDYQGEERFQISIKNLETGELLADLIEGTSSCFEWKSTEGFYYVRLDDQNRPTAVYYHKLGSSPIDDILVYKETDSTFFVGLEGSENDAFIFITCHGYHATEIYAISVDKPDHTPILIEAREDHHEYEVSQHGDSFLILTNDKAENFRIVKSPVENPSRAHWQELVAHDPEILLEGMMVFEHFLLVMERFQGNPRLRVIPHTEGESYLISAEEDAFELGVIGGREFNSPAFRYWYSSPRTPQILFEYDTQKRERVVLKTRPIPDPDFDADRYTVQRVWAPARDGKKIPITLLYRSDLRKEGPQALLMHGYGSYGDILESDFSNYRTVLADHGYICAMAHIRGGMDLGRQWYLDGKLDKKWNSFYDFIDASEFLIRSGWTSKEQLVAEGASAGGLLMGVIANERPDLYCGIIASVPFVDVINTMLDPEQPLTTLEYYEWGHPDDPTAFKTMQSYSPYDNVKAQNYPHMLVVASLHDQRVMYWEAAKWVAKLRHTKTDQNLLLFKVEMNTGHGGPTGRYDALHELAEELCFLIMLKQQKMPQ